MKTYKYWKRVTESLTGPAGEALSITGLGRSNESEAAAAADAREHLARVKAKIAGEEVPEKEDYSADIREEVVAELDPRNVVTRNRYGALVLNTESVSIIDIDEHRKGFLEMLGFKKRENKPAIIEDVGKVAALPEYADLGFRLYETHKGVRLIITGAYCDPEGRGWALMRACNSDPLFKMLCRRQTCYRARLTPKPHRMKMKTMRWRWPMEGDELAAGRAWADEYAERSAAFAVCKYLKTLGRTHEPDAIIKYHDEETRAASGLPLA